MVGFSLAQANADARFELAIGLEPTITRGWQ
jgi:hypothetical protein